MKEYFEHAYEGFINSLSNFIEFLEECGEVTRSIFFCMVIALIYITVPLWALPYAIYKKSRKDKENGN